MDRRIVRKRTAGEFFIFCPHRVRDVGIFAYAVRVTELVATFAVAAVGTFAYATVPVTAPASTAYAAWVVRFRQLLPTRRGVVRLQAKAQVAVVAKAAVVMVPVKNKGSEIDEAAAYEVRASKPAP